MSVADLSVKTGCNCKNNVRSMAVYGYILYQASNLIAGGSEMLELVMSPGLIGGLVLPVMGAGKSRFRLR